MRFVDVNVLIYAHRADLREHRPYREVLEEVANDAEPLGLADAVLAGFVRVITNRRIFNEPTPSADAWRMVFDLLAAPAAMLVRPGERHWQAFNRLADSADARGDDVADAYLAAYAVEANAIWLSADRGFARFRELRWKHPLEDATG
jgi:toxin-antitoxin system PIN domain toxin